MFHRMKIIRGADSMGSTAWSPTVQNIERMKRRRARRARMIVVLVGFMLILCASGIVAGFMFKGM